MAIRADSRLGRFVGALGYRPAPCLRAGSPHIQPDSALGRYIGALASRPGPERVAYFAATKPAYIEVNFAAAGILCRDSKDPDAPVLRFTTEEWNAFVDGVKAGEFDLIADDAEEQSARDAHALRDYLASRVTGSSELMATLEPTLRAARERGLRVTVQVIDGPEAPPQVARAALAALDAVLSALPPHEVVLTVLRSGDDDVELYLIFGAPLRAMPDLARFGLDLPAVARWRATAGETETGGGFLEVKWRMPVLPDPP